MSDVKQWYRSRTIWGALVAVVASLAHMAGVTVSEADQGALIDSLVTLAGVAGGLMAIYGRVKAEHRVK